MLGNIYGVHLACKTFRSNKKWSDRMRETFRLQGKPWNDAVEKDTKRRIADLVAQSPAETLNINVRHPFDGLVHSLEGRLQELEQSR